MIYPNEHDQNTRVFARVRARNINITARGRKLEEQERLERFRMSDRITRFEFALSSIVIFIAVFLGAGYGL